MEKAIILASGIGSRLGELTKETPKPLLKIGEFTILEIIIRNLLKAGVKEIGINTFFKSEKIKEHINSLALPVKFHLIREESLSGTAGAVPLFKDFLNGDDFFVHYGDIVTDQSLEDLIKLPEDKIGSILLHDNPNSNSFIKRDPLGVIKEFHERPKERPSGEAYLANSGVYFFKNQILDSLTTPQASEIIDFPRDIFPDLVDNGQLVGFKLKGKRFAIDSLEKLEKARREVASFNF